MLSLDCGAPFAGATPTDPDNATTPELLFGLAAVVTGGFVYGNIVGNITELARKNNMEGDITDSQTALARAMCRGKDKSYAMDKFLTQKIVHAVTTNQQRRPIADVVRDAPFVHVATNSIETNFATHTHTHTHTHTIYYISGRYLSNYPAAVCQQLDCRSGDGVCRTTRLDSLFAAWDQQLGDPAQSAVFYSFGQSKQGRNL